MRDHGNRLRHFANAAAMTCGPCPRRTAATLGRFPLLVPSAHVPSAALSLLLSAVLAAPAARRADADHH